MEKYTAFIIFLIFVGFTLGLSFWLGRRAKSSAGYFAAHGQVGWFVNGIAFAGDYLSAASFLGICGMIAFYGYDGFLYSIGFLAGWVVALFVIAEPIKKLGKYTFADALSAKFGGSPGITLAAAISTLVVSIFYLIPQMVGAGSLITPVMHGVYDVPHWAGVTLVGGIVILIVVTAGMVSTTWVQFIKGSMLVLFCAALVVAQLYKGVKPNNPYAAEFRAAEQTNVAAGPDASAAEISPKVVTTDGPPKSGFIDRLGDPADAKKAHSPTGFVDAIADATIVRQKKSATTPGQWETTVEKGSELLLPGGYFKGIRSPHFMDRLDFVSLMVALFCGTAALPHILIRYYTVKNASAARKSTVVGIIAIGFFYILTLYIGLGAMVSGNLDPSDGNKSAPLLAQTFGNFPFALISAIAFTTVLGTVSGLILAAAGAVAHDFVKCVFDRQLTDHQQVRVAKITSVVVGVIAVVLGILCEGMNAGFLVGWAFNIAASANLPAIVMILFWRGTTKAGVIASILVGLFSSLLWLLLTKQAFQDIYGLKTSMGVMPFSQPGLVTIPLSFLTLVIVSLFTRRHEPTAGVTASQPLEAARVS